MAKIWIYYPPGTGNGWFEAEKDSEGDYVFTGRWIENGRKTINKTKKDEGAYRAAGEPMKKVSDPKDAAIVGDYMTKHPFRGRGKRKKQSPKKKTPPKQQPTPKKRKVDCGDDEEDIISFESFDELPREMIIKIQGRCYDLKAIYNWVFNNNRIVNPYTNVDFSPADLQLIQTTAQERFPLTVTVSKIQGQSPILKTTSLISLEKLVPQVVPMLDGFQNENADKTLFEFTQFMVDRFDGNLTGRIGGTQPKHIFTWLQEGFTRQIIDITPQNTIHSRRVRIHSSRFATPPATLDKLRKARQLSLDNGWPTDYIDRRIQVIQMVL